MTLDLLIKKMNLAQVPYELRYGMSNGFHYTDVVISKRDLPRFASAHRDLFTMTVRFGHLIRGGIAARFF